jgi:hypothetical protein
MPVSSITFSKGILASGLAITFARNIVDTFFNPAWRDRYGKRELISLELFMEPQDAEP